MTFRIKAFSDSKKKLVEELKAQGIYDVKVLEAFLKIPRHIFVPDVLVFDAYKNRALPLGFGQTISQPLTVAFMTQELEIEETDKVLEVGTGSGFQTAILAFLADKVYTIEVIKELSYNAKQKHKRLGLNNILYKIGNGSQGWKEVSPFNKIIVTAALNSHPEQLFNQLAENGEIIYPLLANKDSNDQKLYKVSKRNKELHFKVISGCNFVIAV